MDAGDCAHDPAVERRIRRKEKKTLNKDTPFKTRNRKEIKIGRID